LATDIKQGGRFIPTYSADTSECKCELLQSVYTSQTYLKNKTVTSQDKSVDTAILRVAVVNTVRLKGHNKCS